MQSKSAGALEYFFWVDAKYSGQRTERLRDLLVRDQREIKALRGSEHIGGRSGFARDWSIGWNRSGSQRIQTGTFKT